MSVFGWFRIEICFTQFVCCIDIQFLCDSTFSIKDTPSPTLLNWVLFVIENVFNWVCLLSKMCWTEYVCYRKYVGLNVVCYRKCVELGGVCYQKCDKLGVSGIENVFEWVVSVIKNVLDWVVSVIKNVMDWLCLLSKMCLTGCVCYRNVLEWVCLLPKMFSYLWDRVCFIFSSAGKFYLAHELRQLTRELNMTSELLISEETSFMLLDEKRLMTFGECRFVTWNVKNKIINEW